MNIRMNHTTANPEGFAALLQLEKAAKKMNADDLVLYELIKIRASQINGCAYCLDMHTKDLRNMGETEQRLHLLAVWRESPIFTNREKAALALTEAVTQISVAGVSTELYDHVREFFSESEVVALIMAINAINCWNRIAVATGMYPGCFDK